MIHDLTQQKRDREQDVEEISALSNKLLGQWEQDVDLETVSSISVGFKDYQDYLLNQIYDSRKSKQKETECN